MTTLTLADVDILERGTALLGAGGGGETRAAAHLLRGRLRASPAVRILAPTDITPDAWVVPVGFVGATSVFHEKPPGHEELCAAVLALTQWCGIQAEAVMPVEGGGLNGVLAFVAATDLRLPLVDADLCGRALPRLDQASLAAVGERLVPLALAEAGGQLAILDQRDCAEVERVVRAILVGSGGWAAMALRPLPAGRLADVAVVGTVKRALGLGEAHAGADTGNLEALAAALGARVLGQGRVLEVLREGRVGGFGRGSVSLVDAASGAIVRVEMENEYLAVLHDGAFVATAPDILCLVDPRTGEPVMCDRVRRSLEVAVLQLAAPPFWTVERRVDYVGPQAFGIHHDPVLLTEGT